MTDPLSPPAAPSPPQAPDLATIDLRDGTRIGWEMPYWAQFMTSLVVGSLTHTIAKLGFAETPSDWATVTEKDGFGAAMGKGLAGLFDRKQWKSTTALISASTLAYVATLWINTKSKGGAEKAYRLGMDDGLALPAKVQELTRSREAVTPPAAMAEMQGTKVSEVQH